MFTVRERARRRPGFVEGVAVQLSDGGHWTIPDLSSPRDDNDRDELLTAAHEAEDPFEGRRAELALTIFLLRRNYDLGPEDFQALLSFAPDDPALSALQRTMHDLVLTASPPHQTHAEPHFMKARGTRGFGGFARLSARFRSAWAHGAH